MSSCFHLVPQGNDDDGDYDDNDDDDYDNDDKCFVCGLVFFPSLLSSPPADCRRALPHVVESILDSLQHAQVLVGGALTSREAYSDIIQPLLVLLLKALSISGAREYIQGNR